MSDTSAESARQAAFGRLLARLRGERNLAQKEAARMAGIDGSTLSRLESGERGVSREVLDRLCDALELDRQQRLELDVAAGFLSEDAAQLLADEEITRLGKLLHDPTLPTDDVDRLRQYVRLALAYAQALGYQGE
jgi:transcriptional regulator with XRE-family HTH domain